MPHIRQQGILSEVSDPVTDADVIMTAAIIGHSYERLNANKNCRYDLEVDKLDPTFGLQSDFTDLAAHVDAIEKINKALLNGKLPKDKTVSVPSYLIGVVYR